MLLLILFYVKQKIFYSKFNLIRLVSKIGILDC